MKIPVDPPKLNEIMEQYAPSLLQWLATGASQPDLKGEYIHWDTLRHKTPPEGLTSRTWWASIKFARLGLKRPLPLRDKYGVPFSVSVTDNLQKSLHYIDREAAGAIQGMERSGGQGRFLIRSLIEESMTSSQLEGAATTRVVAKEMLSTGRQPRDQSERMIYNNHVTMKVIRERGKRAFTVDEILELHAMLTAGTLESEDDCGKLRTAEDNVLIFDRSTDRVLHTPPPAIEVRDRLQALCDFANGKDEESFVHPVIKAIAIHFQLGYDHPFCDGNGRTARVLFYWAMMNAGYWLTEYLSISSVLKKSPGKYMRAYLYAEHDDADMTYFIAQQLDVILESIAALHAYIEAMALGESDIVLSASPMAHLTGYGYLVLLPIILNATTVLQPVWDAHAALRIARAEGVTFSMASTAFVSDLCNAVQAGEEKPPTFDKFLCSGAPIPPILIDRAYELMGMRVCSAWGMTEMGSATVTVPALALSKSSVSDGRPIRGMEVKVVDAEGKSLPLGETGEILFRGASLFAGYLKRPELNHVDADGWFKTGDRGFLDAEGYIRIAGRSKDLVIRGGENIPVIEVENLLYKHPSVSGVAIVGYPDSRLGERMCAFVVLRPGSELSLATVSRYFEEQGVAKQYCPERLEIVDDLPHTPSGKIQKYLLRDIAKSFGDMS